MSHNARSGDEDAFELRQKEHLTWTNTLSNRDTIANTIAIFMPIHHLFHLLKRPVQHALSIQIIGPRNLITSIPATLPVTETAGSAAIDILVIKILPSHHFQRLYSVQTASWPESGHPACFPTLVPGAAFLTEDHIDRRSLNKSPLRGV